MSQYKMIIKGDSFIFIEKTKEGMEFRSEDTFVFKGFFNEIHPYFKKQMDLIKKVLESKNIFLNVVTVSTVDDMCENIDKGYIDGSDLIFQEKFKNSDDGNCYYLLQDQEMGRGWAVLAKKNMVTSEIEIITQEHRDIVQDWLLTGEFIRSFGINYQLEH